MLMWTCCQLTLPDPNSWLQSRDAKNICSFLYQFYQSHCHSLFFQISKDFKDGVRNKTCPKQVFHFWFARYQGYPCALLLYFTISISAFGSVSSKWLGWPPTLHSSSLKPPQAKSHLKHFMLNQVLHLNTIYTS